jgi:hypothetical protein
LRRAKHEFHERIFGRVRQALARAVTRGRGRGTGKGADPVLNIVGVGIGRKVTEGRGTNALAVVIYVRKKLPRRSLSRRSLIPQSIGGLPTDVLETGRIKALASRASPLGACMANPEARQPRPFASGVSIGGARNPAGTLAYPVKLASQTGSFILSNMHVLGDLQAPQAPLPVFQPGFGDGAGSNADRIGTFHRGIPLFFDQSPNRMDAAVALVDDGAAIPLLCGIGRISDEAAPRLDQPVQTFGKTSRFSMGIVKHLDCDITVHYSGHGDALLVDQVRIMPDPDFRVFTAEGDSGCLVVTHDRKAVALAFAGDASTGATYATPIGRVLTALKATLLT